MLPVLKGMLKETITVTINENDLLITLLVKSKIDLKGKLADPEEVKIMFHMF